MRHLRRHTWHSKNESFSIKSHWPLREHSERKNDKCSTNGNCDYKSIDLHTSSSIDFPFIYPKEKILVKSGVIQNINPDLFSSGPNAEKDNKVIGSDYNGLTAMDCINSLLLEKDKHADLTLLKGGGNGKKKRDDIKAHFNGEYVAMGDIEDIQSSIRAKLADVGVEFCHIEKIEVLPEDIQVKLSELPPLITDCYYKDDRELVIFDTDVISRLFKEDTRTRKIQRYLSEHGHKIRCMMSFQTQAELFTWILQKAMRKRRIALLESFLSNFEVVYPDQYTSLIWGSLVVGLRAQGRMVGAQDVWNAACAMRIGAKICTCNDKDYSYMVGVVMFETPDYDEQYN